MKRNVSFATAVATAVSAAVVALWLAVPAAASPAGPAVSGTEHFQTITTSFTSNTAGIIATGVFTAGGIRHANSKVDTFVFPNGTFKVAHSGRGGTQTLDPKTCLFTFHGHGVMKIYGGTGKYAGIRGHGTYQANFLGIAARSGGKCTLNKPATSWQQIIKAFAHVSL
jgi:type IV secretory pathway VirB2 component (pilin)